MFAQTKLTSLQFDLLSPGLRKRLKYPTAKQHWQAFSYFLSLPLYLSLFLIPFSLFSNSTNIQTQSLILNIIFQKDIHGSLLHLP